MAHIVGAVACSHAFALMNPNLWGTVLHSNRDAYATRHGKTPPPPESWSSQTSDESVKAYHHFRSELSRATEIIAQLNPTVVAIIGGDQNEDLQGMLPQLAVFTGTEFAAPDHLERSDHFTKYEVPSDLAWKLLCHLVDAGIDAANIRAVQGGQLRAHAIGPLLKALGLAHGVRILPIYIETVHVPAISPSRCVRVGQEIRHALDGWPSHERVLLCASGGLSHFTASYPFAAVESTLDYGAISEKFDRTLMDAISGGDGACVAAALTNKDLIDNGDVEFRTWATLLGAMGDSKPVITIYEPVYHAIMGMGLALWTDAP